jgi:hypothetical protein
MKPLYELTDHKELVEKAENVVVNYWVKFRSVFHTKDLALGWQVLEPSFANFKTLHCLVFSTLKIAGNAAH